MYFWFLPILYRWYIFIPSPVHTGRPKGHRSLTTHAMPDYPAQPARSLPAPSVGGQKTDEQKPLHRLVTGAQG